MPAATKNTKNNYVFGRPAKYDPLELAQDLLEWAKTDEATNMRKWAIKHTIDPEYMIQIAHTNEYFGKAYRVAKLRIADRREEMLLNGEIDIAFYNRHQRSYEAIDKAEADYYKELSDNKDHERKKDLLKYQAELNANTANVVSADICNKFDNLMNQLSNEQSDLKTAKRRKRTESKSECVTGECNAADGNDS